MEQEKTKQKEEKAKRVIEQEKTKQEQEKTKQVFEQEKTKQMQEITKQMQEENAEKNRRMQEKSNEMLLPQQKEFGHKHAHSYIRDQMLTREDRRIALTAIVITVTAQVKLQI